MRKNKIIIILFLILFSTIWVSAQSITMSIQDTSVVSGDYIDIPIYCDNSLTGKNIVAYTLQLSFDEYYLHAISVSVTGTISSTLGSPIANMSVPGRITLAAAGTSPLSGYGRFIIIRFKAINPGTVAINFTGTGSNYFNEGNPAMDLDNGYTYINPAPAITVDPDNKIIAKGETLQFYCSGGKTPYNWSVTNTSVASISNDGLLTANGVGSTKVVAIDQDGIRDTTNQIEIRAIRLSIPNDLSQLQGQQISVPVNTSIMTGLNICSGSFTINFNKDILTPLGITQAGSLLESYQLPEIDISTPGRFSIAFAGTNPLTGSGALIYIRFMVSSDYGGSTGLTFQNSLFNEDLLSTFTDGYFNAINLPVLSISPVGINIVAGEQQQFIVNGEGTPPFTWSLNDTSIAEIDQTGLLTAKKSGIETIKVKDSLGATVTESYKIYDTRVFLPDTNTCQAEDNFIFPITVGSLPSGESISSFEGTINYDNNYLDFIDLDTTETLTEGWTFTKNTNAGQIIIAGSGSTSFNSFGTIIKLRFAIKSDMTYGFSTGFNLNNFILNEGIPLPLVDNYSNIIINPLPLGAETINGTASVCQGEKSVIYTVPSISNATSYIWTLPTGATGISNANSISIDFGTSAVSGKITVYGHNDCGDGTSSSLNITVNPLPFAADSIAGDTTVCRGNNSIGYNIPAITNASSYIWTLPSGASGTSTTNTINVSFGTYATSGNIIVKGHNYCGNGTSSSQAITVTPLPEAAKKIIGDSTICLGQSSVTYSVPVVANATSYIWTLPSGASGTSTTNTINVTFGASAVSGFIIVKGHNDCGDGISSSISITVNPLPVANVGDDRSLCIGSETQLGADAVSGNNYSWSSSPAGFISTVANPIITPLETTTYSLVETIVATGCSNSQSVTVNINLLPVADAGIDQLIDEGKLITLDGSGSFDPENEDLEYEWRRQNDQVVGVLEKVAFTSPSVTKDSLLMFTLNVWNGICSSLRDSVLINVRNSEVTVPDNFNITDTVFKSNVTDCFGAKQMITVAGDGTSVIFESGSSTYLIAGNSIRFLPGFHAQSGSWMDAHITTDSSFCDRLSASIVSLPAEKSVSDDFINQDNINPIITQSAKVYPNPNNGNFNIEFSNLQLGSDIHIYNMQGRLVHKETIQNTNLQQIYIMGQKQGVYVLKIRDGKETINQKLIIY